MDPNGRNRRKRGQPIHGWVVLDKPLRLGSTPAVSRVRRLMDAQKAGHAGTLDPLATGVLPVALGEATKTVPFMMDAAKSYEFDIRFGSSTETLDAEGEVTGTSDVRPTADAIRAVLPRFIGEVEQIPPKYSAIKIDGQRAYDLARAGKPVEMKTRIVRIDDVRLDGVSQELISAGPESYTASFSVDCGKGTYVRSLMRDICEALGAEGHVSRLRRTRVGPFTEQQSFTLDALEALCDSAAASRALLPLTRALDDIPVRRVSEDEAALLKQGRMVGEPLHTQDTEWVLCVSNGTPIALCQPREHGLAPKRVFNI